MGLYEDMGLKAVNEGCRESGGVTGDRSKDDNTKNQEEHMLYYHIGNDSQSQIMKKI